MKQTLFYTVLIFFLFSGGTVTPQADFFQVYSAIGDSLLSEGGSALQPNDKKKQYRAPRSKQDSAAVVLRAEKHGQFYDKSILPLLKKLQDLTFPDITFADFNNHTWSLSDFGGNDVVLNYNYLYCTPCLARIDSTLMRTKGTGTRVIVLFLDVYKTEIADPDIFGKNVLVAFINEETEDLVSLKLMGDNMYYLNKNRQIEFFDKAVDGNAREAWLQFLDKRF